MLLGRFLRVVLVLVLIMGLGTLPAYALNRHRSFEQLHHSRWTANDGAPIGIRKISQTADGWLWLGSTSGLYRFDGVRFEQFVAAEDPEFGTRPVSTLAAANNGDLWVGLLDGGIARIDPRGHLAVYPLPADLPSFQTTNLATSASGQTWAVVSGQLLVFEGGLWRHPDASFQAPATPPAGLHTDANGALWLASDDRWWRLDPERQQFVERVRGLAAGRAIRIVGGISWVVTADGLHPLPGSERRSGPAVRQPDSSAIWIDDQANVWSAYCPAGLCRTQLPVDWTTARRPLHLPPVTESWTRRDGLTSDIGMTALEDREGNLWVATQSGLDRFRDTLLARFTPSSAATNFLLQSYRVVAPGGPLRQHLLLSAVDAEHGSLLWRWNEHQGFSPLEWSRDRGRIRALHRDGEGREWVGSTTGLWQLHGEKARPVAPPAAASTAPYCTQLLSNRQGLWALFPSVGLQLLRDGAWQTLPFPGLQDERPTAFALEGTTAVWTGYANNRVMRNDEQGAQLYDSRQGLAVGAVTYVYSGRYVLVGGDRGLQMLHQGRFRSLRSTQPEALRGITGATETPAGDLWLNGVRGAVRAPADALSRWVADPQTEVALQVFDSGDGYPAAAMALGPQASVVASGPGRLWFAGLEGIAALDLDRLPAARPGPEVQWLAVAADQRWQDARDDLELPAGTQTVSVRFTALALGAPERVRFETRLMGVDTDWRPLGGQRELSYSHLPPGRHELQVRASLADGPPSHHPATLRFILQPTLLQRLWMRVLLALAGTALLASVLRWRLGLLARREHDRLRIRMDEREQLAQQLNDTLLQGLHGLTLHFQKVANRMRSEDPNHPLMEAALNRADELILQGREQVSALRNTQRLEQQDVAVTWSRLGERRATEQKIAFLMEVEGASRPLRPHAKAALQALGNAMLAQAFARVTGTGTGTRTGAVRARLIWRWWGLRLVVTADQQGAAAASPEALTATAERDTTAQDSLEQRARALGGWIRTVHSRRNADGASFSLSLCVPALRLYGYEGWPWSASGGSVTGLEDGNG